MNTKAFSIHDEKNNIRCILYSGSGAADHVVIYCHGFAGHKGTRAAARFAEYMLPKYKDMAVLCFDWPCHGEDVRKKLSLSDCASYLDSVVRYAKEELHAKALDCFAVSFGGYVVLKRIKDAEDPFRLTVLRSPAVNMYDVQSALLTDADRALLAKGKDVLMGFDRKIAVGAAFMNELKAGDITALDYSGEADKLLILHGEKDEVVPIAPVGEFAERNGIDFIPFPNADHRFSDPKLMTEAIQYIEAFIV